MTNRHNAVTKSENRMTNRHSAQRIAFLIRKLLHGKGDWKM